MRTFRCCLHCAVPAHKRNTFQSFCDDHPHACYYCPADGRGRELVDDRTKLPKMRAA